MLLPYILVSDIYICIIFQLVLGLGHLISVPVKMATNHQEIVREFRSVLIVITMLRCDQNAVGGRSNPAGEGNVRPTGRSCTNFTPTSVC